MNIYVANLSFKTQESELRNAFGQYGEVTSVKIIKDRDTGQSRGFGFVEMDDESGEQAIEALDGATLGGRALKVRRALDK
jgi:RNA recognition motif-containing protein